MGKKWTNDLGFVELIAKETVEHPTLYQRNIKMYQNANPN